MGNVIDFDKYKKLKGLCDNNADNGICSDVSDKPLLKLNNYEIIDSIISTFIEANMRKESLDHELNMGEYWIGDIKCKDKVASLQFSKWRYDFVNRIFLFIWQDTSAPPVRVIDFRAEDFMNGYEKLIGYLHYKGFVDDNPLQAS